MHMEELIKDFLSQMKESALRELRSKNEEYIENYEKLLNLREKLEDFIQAQDDKMQQFFEEYLNRRLLDESMIQDYLYLQGFKDAFRVMKYLGIL